MTKNLDNWEIKFDEQFGKAGPEKNSDSVGRIAGCDDCSSNIELREEVKQFISSLLLAQKAQFREIEKNRDKALAEWIDDNVGVSSEAIFLYMTRGQIPTPFLAPSDEWDRARCIVLLKARPEWISRLKEIENLNIEGTRNDEKVKPWNEQIPLIRDLLTELKE